MRGGGGMPRLIGASVMPAWTDSARERWSASARGRQCESGDGGSSRVYVIRRRADGEWRVVPSCSGLGIVARCRFRLGGATAKVRRHATTGEDWPWRIHRGVKLCSLCAVTSRR